MSHKRKVDGQRQANLVAEARRKLTKASARRAGLMFTSFKTAEERALEAIRASVKA